ncbi:Fe-S cluster assembly protein SufD [Parvibaculum sp.]|uniref:Fe-S cluster assembly protein SufD n=1 Tax=Parvibaculum sp. TaxID=2024848 RepID=UPI00391B1E02
MNDKATANFVTAFEMSGNELPGAGGWLARRRSAAVKAFAESGLPHRRLEDWKYTDLRQALDKAGFAPAPEHKGAVILPETSAATAFASIDAFRLVFVNGRFHEGLSESVRLPKGVELHRLADVLSEQWAKTLIERRMDEARQAENIVELNTALMADGMALRIRKGVTLDKPLHLVFVAADAGASHTRNLVLLEEGAEASILESHLGGKAALADIVTDVELGAGATLRHVKLQDETADAVHISTLRATLAAKARLESFTLTLGCGLSRSQNFIRFEGEGAHASVDGAYALRAKQHFDTFSVVDHAVPACTSHTLFKGVLDGEAEGVFQGKVIVRPNAQKTDGRQMTQALLLSRDASMNAKPELEIYADDVQCAHGSTVGELSKDAIFYLRSRGIPKAEARRLLVLAFLEEAIELAPHKEAREIFRDLVSGWFEEAAS